MLVMCTFPETGLHEKAGVLPLYATMKNVMQKMPWMPWMEQSWMVESWECRWQDMADLQIHTEEVHPEDMEEAADTVEG